ncbi:hypothetical protein CSC70_02385 [Pseudoxanthomonas kalamensis DSM 18571]|uniref:HdeD family acid-resistance protein n=1 Tax=Pseudoxanthomonas kalamensis TaxID=289483 RepID=UPI00139119F0|nr:DUF308 domain-containing protein [Pseudoxanthomonas kalamensis]KAF1712390.1 hypothetical protein CSC70_02385 [Pseudoxanthomonas kalamensis DSM 18571]
MNETAQTTPVTPLSLLGRSWWVLLVYGLFAVIFGVVALLHPLQAAAALAWTIGILAVAEGLVSLFALFDKQVAVSKGWLLFYALVSIAFGVLAVLNPVATAAVLLMLLAAWLIVGGIFRIVFAIKVRKLIEGEWMIILSGALSIILGIMFVAKPLAGVAVTTLWIGALALVYGVFQIVAAFKLRKFK